MMTTIRLIALAPLICSLLGACQKPASATNDPLSSEATSAAVSSEKPALNIIGESRAEEGQVAGNSSAKSEWIACPEERPEICTQIYQPVCATVDTGIRCVTAPCPSETTRTFGNACSACADPRALGYSPGECAPEQPSDESSTDSTD